MGQIQYTPPPNKPDYGGICVLNNTTPTAIVTAGVPVQVLVFDTNDPSRGIVPDHTNDHVTIFKTGDYAIMMSATVNSVAGPSSHCHITVEKNDGASIIGGLLSARNMAGGAGESGSMTLSGIATLAAGDTIEVWIENMSATDNYVVENVSLIVIQLN